MKPYYLIQRSSDGKVYFVLRAENHETILTSETYNDKESVFSGIASCQINSALYDRYRPIEPGLLARSFHFTLIAANHEPIGTSETYSSRFALAMGMGACTRCGPTAQVYDFTIKVA